MTSRVPDMTRHLSDMTSRVPDMTRHLSDMTRHLAEAMQDFYGMKSGLAV